MDLNTKIDRLNELAKGQSDWLQRSQKRYEIRKRWGILYRLKIRLHLKFLRLKRFVNHKVNF